MVVFFKVCAHSDVYTIKKYMEILFENGEVKNYEISVFDEKNV